MNNKIPWKDWNGLVQFAYRSAKTAFDLHMDFTAMEKKFFEPLICCSEREFCEDVAKIYFYYLNSEITLEEGEKKKAAAKKKYLEDAKKQKDTFTFLQAACEAGKNADRNGYAQFVCPLCKGKAEVWVTSRGKVGFTSCTNGCCTIRV